MARCLVLSVASFSVACYGAHAAGSLDSVRSLIEKRSGSNLALRSVLSRLSSTDMNSTMEALMLDINSNIVSRMELDHKATQDEISDVASRIHEGEVMSQTKKDHADNRGRIWKKCVGEEKALLVTYEKHMAEEDAQKQKLDAAQSAFDNTEGQVKASPSLGEFKIDFALDGHSSESVASKLNVYKQTMTTMMSTVNLAREEKYTEFVAARGKLQNAATGYRIEQNRALEFKSKSQQKRGKCADDRGKRVGAMCVFGDQINAKCQAVRDYTDLMTKVDAVNGDEFSHVDRVQEWKVVQTALCLVRLLKEQATIDEASLSTCEEEAMASFETQIGTLNRKATMVNELAALSDFPCDATTITFDGGNYNLAVCGEDVCPEQRSADLTWSGDYSPAISISDDEDVEPFEFCD